MDIEPSLPGDPQGSPGEGRVWLPQGNRTDSKRTHAQKGASAGGWAPRIMALEEAQESGRRMSGPREGRLASPSRLHGRQPYPGLRTAGLTKAHLIQKHLAAPPRGGGAVHQESECTWPAQVDTWNPASQSVREVTQGQSPPGRPPISAGVGPAGEGSRRSEVGGDRPPRTRDGSPCREEGPHLRSPWLQTLATVWLRALAKGID